MDLFDYQDALGEAFNGEKLIGSTVIDLEDSSVLEGIFHATWQGVLDGGMNSVCKHAMAINRYQ